MFGSVKVKHWRLAAMLLIGLVILAAACVLMARSAAPDALEIGGGSYSLYVEDQSGVKSFLDACGYDGAELLFENEITVPKNWDETYCSYNELQRQQGFDLVPYKGKAAIKYEYSVPYDCFITVLVSDNRIIAAHRYNYDGVEKRIVPE